jgi:hypothetical protein
LASTISAGGAFSFDWTSGTLHVGTFNGKLANRRGVLAPGHSVGSTTINGNYHQTSDEAVLEIEIGGPLAGSQFDFVNVTGGAQLDGELHLTLTGGFTPTSANTFTILHAALGFIFSFDNVANGQRLTTTDGLGSFLVNYGIGSPFDDNQVVLSNFLPALSGDYNQNGVVDAADYTLWRKNLGSGTALPNDDTPGVGPDDYTRWKTHFGQTAGSGAAAIADAAVPEPCSAPLFILGAGASAALATRRRLAAGDKYVSSV